MSGQRLYCEGLRDCLLQDHVIQISTNSNVGKKMATWCLLGVIIPEGKRLAGFETFDNNVYSIQNSHKILGVTSSGNRIIDIFLSRIEHWSWKGTDISILITSFETLETNRISVKIMIVTRNQIVIFLVL